MNSQDYRENKNTTVKVFFYPTPFLQIKLTYILNTISVNST